MDNNEILQEYWYTDLSGSHSDISQSQSQSTDDQVIDIMLVMKEIILYGTSMYNKTPYHMSPLKGEMWVMELLCSHPE